MHISTNHNILYSLIIRTKDGMPLSASTDFNDEVSKNLKECKRYVKLLSKKAQQFPERCVLQLPSYSIYFISYIGVTYLILCASSYPTVLAFSFLNELMKEFISLYNKAEIDDVLRPYSFLNFDNFIHKTCQRYNKPQSLTTRINLSELSLEIKLRPPYVISLEEIEPSKKSNRDIKLPYAVSHRLQFQDLTFISFCAMSLTILLSLVSLFRGFVVLFERSYEEAFYEYPIMHGVFFVLDATARWFQIYMLLRQMKYRKLSSWLTLFLLCFITWCMMPLRDDTQNVLFIVSIFLMHFCILCRQIQSKLPDYQCIFETLFSW